MVKKKLILVGGGGHCKSCIDVIEAQKMYSITGIVDVPKRRHEQVMGYTICASDGDIAALVKKNTFFLVSLGSTKDCSRRVATYEHIKKAGGDFALIVAPSAVVARTAFLGEATVVLHNAVVNADARVGKNCIINTLALIEHDAVVGDHTHVSTGSLINGRCVIGKRVFVGSGSVICHDVKVCDDVVIGAGSVVICSIDKPGVYVGNPARKI